VLAAICAALPARAAAPDRDPQQLLRQAFTNQYEVDTTATIDLVIRSAAGEERRRTFDAASKIIGGRMHSIGRLTHPEHLRGMTILQIEAPDRSHDAFVYLPSMQSVRRISTAQRGDAFFGTDVTYEDLERRHPEDYEVIGVEAGSIDGEEADCVRARPRLPHSYHEVHFWIARADHVLLRADFFKRGTDRPYRRIVAPRQGMRTGGEHTLPTRLTVHNFARGTTTRVSYRRLRIGATIDDRLFSIRTLEQRARIPGAR
jgi:hypothetical protein